MNGAVINDMDNLVLTEEVKQRAEDVKNEANKYFKGSYIIIQL